MFKVALITALPEATEDPGINICIGLAQIYLATYLDNNTDVEVAILRTSDEVIKYKPDIMGISSVTQFYGLAIDIAQKIKKELGIPIVIGGNHITICPESFKNCFDVGVIGEGEQTFYELVESFKSQENRKNIKKIKGIIYLDKNKIKKTPPRPPIKFMDDIPIPNRKKWIEKIGLPYIMTSRGCPYRCSFCSVATLWPKYREHSPEYVIEELKSIRRDFSPPHIRFFDDIFILNKKRLRSILELMKKENLNKDISYSCWARSELVDDEIAATLKEMNFISAGLGIESVSSKILKTLKGKTASIDIHQKAIDTLNKFGIDAALAFIIGSPHEKKEDLESIYNFILKNEDKISEIEINPLRPMPGTIYWKMAYEKGLVGFDMDWGKLSDYSLQLDFNKDNFIYLNENMTFDEFVEMKDKLFSLYPRINMSQKNIENSTKLINAHNFPAKIKSIF